MDIDSGSVGSAHTLALGLVPLVHNEGSVGAAIYGSVRYAGSVDELDFDLAARWFLAFVDS